MLNLLKNDFFGFVGFIIHSPLSVVGFVILVTFSLSYPGENPYLTEHLVPQRKLVRDFELPKPVLAPYPFLTGSEAPKVEAPAVVVLDVPSKVLMYEKNPTQRMLPASTTKIMTALVALEHFPLDQAVTVGEVVNGSTMGLVSGERITVRNLLYGLMLVSGNDAAYALADAYPGGREAFIKRMNERAKELYLTDTHFTNPAGFDASEHFSSARDMARLAAFALQQDLFEKIVSTKEMTVSSADSKIVHRLENINKLLGNVKGVNGVKTGWTEKAGECLVTSATVNGRQVVVVIFKSTDRFGETSSLLDWAFRQHTWKSPYEAAL